GTCRAPGDWASSFPLSAEPRRTPPRTDKLPLFVPVRYDGSLRGRAASERRQRREEGEFAMSTEPSTPGRPAGPKDNGSSNAGCPSDVPPFDDSPSGRRVGDERQVDGLGGDQSEPSSGAGTPRSSELPTSAVSAGPGENNPPRS